MQGHKQVKTLYSECTKIFKNEIRAYFIEGYENLNKDRKILQSLYKVTKI